MKLYDEKCEDLARYFLNVPPYTEEHIQELAEEIQDAVEGWVRNVRVNHDNKNPMNTCLTSGRNYPSV